MASVVELCNLALARLGQATINSLGEASTEATACGLLFGPARNVLLRRHAWRFATKRSALARLDEPAPAEWTFVYALPGDCLAARYVEPPEGAVHDAAFAPPVRAPAFDRRGTRLMCDVENAVLVYTEKVVDPARFDALFSEALVCRLAVDLSMALGAGAGVRELMQREAVEALETARAADGGEAMLQTGYDADWIRARR